MQISVVVKILNKSELSIAQPASIFMKSLYSFCQFMASHLCHRNEKQSLLIGVKRVIKSQGTCQNTQFVTRKSCQLVSSHNPTPKKVIAILKQSRATSQQDSEGMRNSHPLGATAGIQPSTAGPFFLLLPTLPVQLGCRERPRHNSVPTGKVCF